MFEKSCHGQEMDVVEGLGAQEAERMERGSVRDRESFEGKRKALWSRNVEGVSAGEERRSERGTT